MSKKTKWSIIGLSALLVAMVVLSLMTIFVWTKPVEKKIKLETPKFSLSEDEDVDGNLKILLISDNNLSASGYSFYIYDGKKPEDTYNYIEHKTDKFYFDATKYLTDAKTYYFYCKCRGNELVNDSDISEVKSYVNKYNLTIPELAINGTELSWTNVPNASGYKVYMNDTIFLTQTTEKKYDISAFINNQKTENTFYVVAVGDIHYYDSEQSNVVKHIKTITSIDDITNFRVEETTKKLYWTSVPNATKYEIVVNGSQTFYTTGTPYDFSSLLTSNGIYSFKARAIKDDIDDVLYSNYTELKTYTKTGKLEKVSLNSITAQKDTNTVTGQVTMTFNWSAVQNANYYKVVIKIDGQEVSSQNMMETSIVVYKPENANNVTIEITVLSYDYYLDSDIVTKTVNF